MLCTANIIKDLSVDTDAIQVTLDCRLEVEKEHIDDVLVHNKSKTRTPQPGTTAKTHNSS